RDEAGNLARALKGQAQTQGAWGEMILSTVLEKAGLREGEEFVVQESHTLESGERLRPDVVVNFPDGKKLVVDSKVSLVAFERCVNCDDEAERAAHLNEHLKSVRNHIKGLSGKDYARLYGGVDFVILFVPVEGALSLAIQNDPNIQTEAVERGVMIASPNTLLMGMRTVQNVWMREYQNRNVTKIADRAGKLYDKFVGFAEDMEKIGVSLNNARNAYEDARGKLASGRGNLVRQAEELKKLGAKTSKKLPEPLLALGDDGDDENNEDESGASLALAKGPRQDVQGV
ncbi:MAG: DNA recombination protein RmuC, partial [Verrucomicrobiaceae bacterium]